MTVHESDVFIDDVRLQDLDITVRLSSQEPALPALRNQSVVVPNRHGAFDYGGWLEPREFVLNCVFARRQTYADIKRAIRDLNALLIDEWGRPKTVKLRFGDAPDVYYSARLTSGVAMERVSKHGIFSLTLTAFDPFAYSNVTADEVVWGSDVLTFSADYTLGHKGGGAVTITAPTTLVRSVGGQAVRPQFEFVGSATSVTVSANGKSFALGSFSNATVVVDGEQFTVTVDGANSLSLMTGDFVELLPGDNEITVTGSGMNFELTVSYRDKYA